jgi:hypothetical protein
MTSRFASRQASLACLAGVCLLFPGLAAAQVPAKPTFTFPATLAFAAAEAPANPVAAETGSTVPDTSAGGRDFGDGPRWAAWRRVTGDWAHLRDRLEAAGVRISAWSVSDVSRMAGPDLPAGAAARGLFDVDAAFDLGTLAGLRGATVFVQYFGNAGSNGSEALQAYQSFSNIDADRFRRIGEFWYEQWLPGRRVRLKVGRVDANSEFARVENGSEFINAAMGYSPTISALPPIPRPPGAPTCSSTPPRTFTSASAPTRATWTRGTATRTTWRPGTAPS